MLSLAYACAALVPVVGIPPPCGVYSPVALPSLCVIVQSPTKALVRWSPAERAAARLVEGRGVVFDEPLASRARQAGVLVSALNFDASSDTLSVAFDGRMTFTVDLKRVTRAYGGVDTT